jgi:hypothetical protein
MRRAAQEISPSALWRLRPPSLPSENLRLFAKNIPGPRDGFHHREHRGIIANSKRKIGSPQRALRTLRVSTV